MVHLCTQSGSFRNRQGRTAARYRAKHVNHLQERGASELGVGIAPVLIEGKDITRMECYLAALGARQTRAYKYLDVDPHLEISRLFRQALSFSARSVFKTPSLPPLALLPTLPPSL